MIWNIRLVAHKNCPSLMRQQHTSKTLSSWIAYMFIGLLPCNNVLQTVVSWDKLRHQNQRSGPQYISLLINRSGTLRKNETSRWPFSQSLTQKGLQNGDLVTFGFNKYCHNDKMASGEAIVNNKSLLWWPFLFTKYQAVKCGLRH